MCGVTVHNLIESTFFFKKRKPLVPKDCFFGSPGYEVGFCYKTVICIIVFFYGLKCKEITFQGFQVVLLIIIKALLRQPYR